MRSRRAHLALHFHSSGHTIPEAKSANASKVMGARFTTPKAQLGVGDGRRLAKHEVLDLIALLALRSNALCPGNPDFVRALFGRMMSAVAHARSQPCDGPCARGKASVMEDSKFRLALISAMFAFGYVGCGHPSGDTGHDAAVAADAAVGVTFQQQVAEGETLYMMRCAGCHGANGEGARTNPPLVGLASGALPRAPREGSRRTIEFMTVADIGDYTAMTMPPRAPGSLSSEEYWAILAFTLHENGMDFPSALDSEVASGLVIPR